MPDTQRSALAACASVLVSILVMLSIVQCGGNPVAPPPPPQVAVSAVSLSSPSAAVGSAIQGTITLTVAAPTGGATVGLNSSNPAVATVAANVTIAAGSSTGSFTVAAVSAGTTTITASLNATRQADLTVTQTQPPSGATLLSIGLNNPTIVGGQSVDGVVTLSSGAPAGGAVVTLQSSDTSVATIPASVLVAAGSTSATFTVTTRATGGAFQLTISATYGGVTRTTNLTVSGTPPPLALSSVSVTPSTIASGGSATGTVTLNQAAPSGGTVVALSSSPAGFVTTPGSVPVASGASTATFTVSAAATSSSRTAVITATLNGTSQTATVNITAAGPTASFVVTSPSGADTCQLTSGGLTVDCTFDGRASTGATNWDFTYIVVTTQTNSVTTGTMSPTFPGCGFFNSNFPVLTTTQIQMQVRLRVRDSAGNTSAEAANNNVRITAGGAPGSPGACGYSF